MAVVLLSGGYITPTVTRGERGARGVAYRDTATNFVSARSRRRRRTSDHYLIRRIASRHKALHRIA